MSAACAEARAAARGTYSRICRTAPYLPKMSYISSAVMLNGRFLQQSARERLAPAEAQRGAKAHLMYSTRFTSGGRRACGGTTRSQRLRSAAACAARATAKHARSCSCRPHRPTESKAVLPWHLCAPALTPGTRPKPRESHATRRSVLLQACSLRRRKEAKRVWFAVPALHRTQTQVARTERYRVRGALV